MPVSVSFINGNTREFADATDAFQHGAMLVVTRGETELYRFDFQSVVSATVLKDDGPVVVQGGAPRGEADGG